MCRKPKLYIWDNAIIVLANSLSEARMLATDRLKNTPTLVSDVWGKIPAVMHSPGVYIVFHKGTNHVKDDAPCDDLEKA